MLELCHVKVVYFNCFLLTHRQNDQNETEDMSEENDDQQTAAKKGDSEQATPSNPRRDFNENLVNLLKGLVAHLDPDKAVDDMLKEFFSGRLPPFGGDIKKGKLVYHVTPKRGFQ